MICLSLLPVKVSGEAVNTAVSVSCGSPGKCVCVRVCVLSCGSVCLRMFVCGDVLLVGACTHGMHVCVGLQFLSALQGSCAGAKCPAAHRCLFTG